MGRKKSKSKRRSSTSPPPELPPLLVDHCLGGVAMVDALRARGLEAHKLTDHFPQDIPDVDLFVEVSARGWVLLTKDKAMRRRPNEREMIVNAKVRVFNFSSANITGPEMIEALLKALPRMARFVKKHDPPFAVKIARDGTLERMEL